MRAEITHHNLVKVVDDDTDKLDITSSYSKNFDLTQSLNFYKTFDY